MEATRKNNYFLGTNSYCICELILCNRGSDHIFSLIPFPGQVKILVFCRSFHLSNLYIDLPSSIAPCYLKDIVSLHYLLWILIGMILHHIIPSLIVYISIMLILTVLPGPYARSNFRRRAKLTSIFLILSFHLEQQAWFRACVISVVPITFRLIIPFAWCRRCSMASS